MMAATPYEESLGIQASFPAENVLLKDGDVIIPSCTIFQQSQKPVKKQTRQWAAWTRQEEESFFNALRQVGKDFEKITYRVQSKNKDQVRHYYYRLVRRMNKLLCPGLCLDSKNSKDTVAAMLRWWSLLEKFSCASSKLHLRPRRFKIFVETLENQLLKDRNKNRRKRPSQGDNSLAPSSTSLISKAVTNDARPVKVFVVDSQNSHKVGANKGTSLRRNVSPSVSFNKEDLSTTKTVKQKRKGVASASYKRWEKAAMAGVSLVADAAEQLERAVNNDRNCSSDQGNFSVMPPEIYTTDGMCSHQIREATPQLSLKLKLQLFPMDEGTRRALEKDAHNPHLELTLSARKRISSVLEHLSRKWGNSTIGMGEVMLFPYSAQQEDVGSHQRWTTRNTDATAADVFAAVGSPSIFRLRYGWFCSPEVGSGIVNEPSSTSFENQICSKNIEEVHAKDVPDTETVAADIMQRVTPTSHFSDPVEFSKHQSTLGVALVRSVSERDEPLCGGGSSESEPMCGASSSRSSYRPPNTSSETTFSSLGNNMAQLEDMVNLGTSNHVTISTGEWADSLTTISVGDLLSEASKAADSSCLNSSAGGQLEQIPFSCDSFDAVIAAHVSGHQLTNLSTEVSHASIWNAEETCDEFSFQNIPASRGNNSNPLDTSYGVCTQVTHPNSSGQYSYHNELPESKPSEDPSYHNQKTEFDSAKQLSYDNRYDPAGDTFLTDTYWPDSLGPFELNMPSSRYQSEDMLLGESTSLGGLSRLIASSVDAFQNCSFFGMDKKDISAGEVQGVPMSLDNKIGSED